MEINKIYNEDCIQTMRQMPDNFISLVVTSPPYNLGIVYDNYFDRRKWEDYFNWCREWLKELYRVMREDGRVCINHYLSCGSGKRGYDIGLKNGTEQMNEDFDPENGCRVAPIMELNHIATHDIRFKHHSVAVWEDPTLSRKTAWGSWLDASSPYINSPHESILFLYKNHWKKDTKGITQITDKEFIAGTRGNWKIQPEMDSRHPAPFPLRLAERCILLLSYEGDLVYDPFMGSGTTAEAARRHKRNFIGSEISERYIRQSNERMGQTFLF